MYTQFHKTKELKPMITCDNPFSFFEFSFIQRFWKPPPVNKNLPNHQFYHCTSRNSTFSRQNIRKFEFIRFLRVCTGNGNRAGSGVGFSMVLQYIIYIPVIPEWFQV